LVTGKIFYPLKLTLFVPITAYCGLKTGEYLAYRQRHWCYPRSPTEVLGQP